MSKQQITRDLCIKISDDVTKAMSRTLEIAPERYPLIVAAGAAALGYLTAQVTVIMGYPRDKPDPRAVMLAALILARASSDGKHDPAETAKVDLAILQKMGRI